jgi:hypothetical protein
MIIRMVHHLAVSGGYDADHQTGLSGGDMARRRSILDEAKLEI